MKRILLEEYLEVPLPKGGWYRCTCGLKGHIPLYFSVAVHEGERYRIIKVYGWKK